MLKRNNYQEYVFQHTYKTDWIYKPKLHLRCNKNASTAFLNLKSFSGEIPPNPPYQRGYSSLAPSPSRAFGTRGILSASHGWTTFQKPATALSLGWLLKVDKGERGGSVVECRTPEREVGGSIPTAAVLCPWARHFTPRKYWLITQETVAPSRHDWKIVDWDVKPQHKQKKSRQKGNDQDPTQWSSTSRPKHWTGQAQTRQHLKLEQWKADGTIFPNRLPQDYPK